MLYLSNQIRNSKTNTLPWKQYQQAAENTRLCKKYVILKLQYSQLRNRVDILKIHVLMLIAINIGISMHLEWHVDVNYYNSVFISQRRSVGNTFPLVCIIFYKRGCCVPGLRDIQYLTNRIFKFKLNWMIKFLNLRSREQGYVHISKKWKRSL